MHPRTRAAVAACTRTLSAADDAGDGLRGADAVTIGPLRAAADRLALRRRFHDPAIHAAARPPDGAAAVLFDSLEEARLDARGAQWLAGVRHNLLAFPGAAEDGVRWLAFESFCGVPPPAAPRDAVAHARAHLPGDLSRELVVMADLVEQQPAFASAAADWCRRAAGAAPLPGPPSSGRPFDIPEAPGGVDIRRGRFALPGRARAAADEGEHDGGGEHAGPRPPAHDPVAPLIGYRVYTTAFDRVVQAAALAPPEELAGLRARLDDDFAPLRSVVARLAKRLMRVLMAKQVREWRFDLDEGWLESSRLGAFVASRGRARPFKQEFEAPFPSTVVSLLIDHSGSMAGRPMRIAAMTVEVFARVLERCGVRCEVLGFTTRGWDGGEPARQWAAAGYPPAPGRLNALEHIVIKGADTPWRRARRGLGLSLRDGVLKENIDGEALTWAHQRLLARPERRRILIVISDGTPMDEATFAANGFEYLDGHLAAVVRHIETRSVVRLAAIGIGHDVSQFYADAVRVTSIDELGRALTAKLTALLET